MTGVHGRFGNDCHSEQSEESAVLALTGLCVSELFSAN
jgi:hypothetical protein